MTERGRESGELPLGLCCIAVTCVRLMPVFESSAIIVCCVWSGKDHITHG